MDIGSLIGDLSGVQQHANNHSNGHSEDSSIFSSALGMIQSKQGQLANEGIDENHMVQAHQNFFGGGNGGGGQATSGGIGAASAMQALKMFQGGGGGGGQQEFMGMAMGQAAKLFDHQSANGNVADGASKQGAVQQAGEYALKMYMQSQMGSGGGGLMSMASKFM